MFYLTKNKTALSLLLLTVLISLLFPIALAAQQDDAGYQMVQGRVLTPLEKKMSKIVSANYVNVPIEVVLTQLTTQADVDIIISPDVTGNVNVALTDVPLYEALTNILAAYDYGYIATENMIRVVPRDQIAVDSLKMVNRVYHITYADVKEVAKALDKFLTSSGELAVNPGTSHIMVSDTEHKIAAIDAFINEIDRETPQVLIEARIYDVTYKDKLDLGVQWHVATRTSFDPTTGAATGGTLNPYTGGFVESPLDKANASSSGFRFGILNNSLDIDLLMKAEQEDINATLLANPRILVLDNEKALFKSVTEIPYQELQETSSGGSIGTTEFKEVGVKLIVTPHIARDGMIRIRIQPEFSVHTRDVDVGGVAVSGIPQPVVDSREADTTLLVRSGQVVVLGGMRKKDIAMQKNKVPLLGDLPLIGGLFSFEGEETTNSELVLFVTTTIVKQPVMTPDELEQLERTNLPALKNYKKGKVDRMRRAIEEE